MSYVCHSGPEVGDLQPLNQQIFQGRTVVPQGKFQQLSVSSLSARRPGSGLKG